MRRVLMLMAAMAALICWAGQAPAQEAPAGPGYCLRCHSNSPVLNLGVLSWAGPVASEREHPCPGVSRIKDELYLTQSLIFTAAKVLKQHRLEGKGESWREVMRIKARYRHGLNQPVWSLDQVIGEQAALRQEITRRILRPAWGRAERAERLKFWGIAALIMALLSACALLMHFRHRRTLIPPQSQNSGRQGPKQAQTGQRPGKNASHEKAATRLKGLVLLLGLGLAALSCDEPAPLVRHEIEPPQLQQAREELDSLIRQERRCVALWLLGSKSESMFPKLSTGYFKQALEAAERAADRRYLRAADSLRKATGAMQARFRSQAERLASRLEKGAREAWRHRLVADGAGTIWPELAQRAMDLALQRIRGNPDQKRRDWDLAALIITMARRNRERALKFVHELKDPLARSWVRRKLGLQLLDAALLRAARKDAEKIAEPAIQALVLSQVAGGLWQLRAAGGDEVFGQALQKAHKIKDPQRARMVLGECAARFLAPTSPLMLSRVWDLTPGKGARFKALHQAAQSLLAMDPDRGRQVWEAALTEAAELELDGERDQALALLVRDLAALDPQEAERAYISFPGKEGLMSQEAQAYLALAGAGRNLARALYDAGRLQDYSLRFTTLARLAQVQYLRDRAQGRQVYTRLLSQVEELGFDLIPPEILATTAVVVLGEDSMGLSGRIPGNLGRGVYLFNLAKIFTKKERVVAGRKSLQISLTAIKSADTKLILDKVRLLSNMGRGWINNDRDQARAIFEQAAVLAE